MNGTAVAADTGTGKSDIKWSSSHTGKSNMKAKANASNDANALTIKRKIGYFLAGLFGGVSTLFLVSLLNQNKPYRHSASIMTVIGFIVSASLICGITISIIALAVMAYTMGLMDTSQGAAAYNAMYAS
jgi:hypothetical protein